MIPRHLNTILSIVVCSSGLWAQTYSVEARTPVGVYASGSGMSLDVDLQPATRTLELPLQLAARSGRARATLDVMLTNAGLSLRTSGRVGTSSLLLSKAGTTLDSTGQGGRPELVATVTAPRRTTGRIIVDIDSSATAMWVGTGSGHVLAGVQVGATVVSKSSGLTPPVHHEIPATIGPTGLDVELRILGTCSTYTTNANYAAAMDISFEPDCIAAPFGSGCASLTASMVSAGTIEFAYDGRIANSPAVLIGGHIRVQMATPFPGCLALVEPVVGIPFATDGRGDGGLTIAVPAPGIAFQSQAAAVDFASATGETSNGIGLTFWF